MAMETDIHYQTILNHPRKAGYKKKLDVCVLHEIHAEELTQWFFFAKLYRNETESPSSM